MASCGQKDLSLPSPPSTDLAPPLLHVPHPLPTHLPSEAELRRFTGRWRCVEEVNRAGFLEVLELNVVVRYLVRLAAHIPPPNITAALEAGTLVNYVSIMGFQLRDEYKSHVYHTTARGVTARVSMWWSGVTLHSHTQSLPPWTLESFNRRYVDADGLLHIRFLTRKSPTHAPVEYRRVYRRCSTTAPAIL